MPFACQSQQSRLPVNLISSWPKVGRSSQTKRVIVGFILQQIFAIEGAILLSPMKGRGRGAPMTGSQTLLLNLHQSFATPEGLILLCFWLAAKLTFYETDQCRPWRQERHFSILARNYKEA
jgi:hypothetical protein